LRDAAERAAEFVETLGSVAELADHKDRPLVADAGQHVAHRTAILGNMEGTGYAFCAFLSLFSGHLFILGIKS
jgi:hypothetical protein